MAGEYRFTFGPWNIHEGGDPIGPSVRDSIAFADKLKLFKSHCPHTCRPLQPLNGRDIRFGR